MGINKEAASEFSDTCGLCNKTGGVTFARIFWRRIMGNWYKICNECWEEQNESVKTK